MLKIGQPRNAYDLLGLPRSAASVQVRARYRQLVRRYRKELSGQQLLEDEQFRAWTNAYLTLIGPERREYDHRLRQSRGREQPSDALSQLSAPRRVLIQAEAAFLRRKLNEAAELAKAALKQESRNAETYALLGDILREQAKYDDALTMYNYAIQFDPNNSRYWQLLQEVTALREGHAIPRRYRREFAGPLDRPPSTWVAVGLSLVFVELSIWYLQGRWGAPLFFGIPTNFVYAAVGHGFLLGLVLAGTAILGPFDDELFNYNVTGMGGELIPIGVFVALPGIVVFWAAPVFYLIASYLDERLSLSVLIALFVCSALTVGYALIVPEEGRRATWILGGNFVYFGFLVGWLAGSMRARVFQH